jgi:hypothetical protein
MLMQRLITTGVDTNQDGVVNDRPAGVGRNSKRGSAQANLDLRLSWELRRRDRRIRRQTASALYFIGVGSIRQCYERSEPAKHYSLRRDSGRIDVWRSDSRRRSPQGRSRARLSILTPLARVRPRCSR